jgi:N-acetylmuramoyl-L-alanine amidase
MSNLKYLVIHCTATPEGREVSAKDIFDWHTNPKPLGRGWSRVGYTDLIQLDGTLLNLRPFNQDNDIDNWEITNGARGYNGVARHVVYAGGLTKDLKAPKDTRTKAQLNSLETYVKYMVLRHPDIKVIGHNQISNRDCPSFNVTPWLVAIGVNPKNIGL